MANPKSSSSVKAARLASCRVTTYLATARKTPLLAATRVQELFVDLETPAATPLYINRTDIYINQTDILINQTEY